MSEARKEFETDIKREKDRVYYFKTSENGCIEAWSSKMDRGRKRKVTQ